jgi:phosphoribosyl 1,2-cyclic phosphodiesterase
LIVDSGSGFRRLGEELARRWNRTDYHGDRTAHVLLTHAHMDHTFATPFVEPYYDDRNTFTIWAPRRVLQSLDAVLSPTSSLRSIYFPPTYDALEGIKQFREIQAGEAFQLGGIHIQTLALNHPGEALAFRLDGQSSSIVIASDHEQTAVPDAALAEFARDADVLYTDAQYLRAEYEGLASIADEPPTRRVGWGHSHMEGAVETAVVAGVGSLHLGHHDPKRDDVHLARMEQAAQHRARDLLERAGRDTDSMTVHLAREGQTFCLS